MAATNSHGCNVTTCPNGKCQQTGECIEAVAATLRAVPRPRAGYDPRCCHKTVAQACEGCPYLGEATYVEGTPPVESPPLVPDAWQDGTHYVLGAYSTPAPRLLIAFTGLAGAGKSTAAAHLVKHRGFTRLRFAGPLKAMMAALGLTAAQVDGDEKEVPCELLGGKTPRHAMQTLGTEWGRNLISQDLWIRAWQAALPATGNVVVDDCRFPNEAAAVQAAGGLLVRIERPGAGTASAHSSETHALPAARTLHNTLSERNLREQVDIFLADLSWAERAAS